MAPRKATQVAAASSPLNACSVGVSGSVPGTTQAALQARITALGASFAKSITSDTSFVIATEKEVEKDSAKIKSAASHNVPVASIGWLDQCEATATLADHSPYLLSSATTASQSQKDNGKKRAASPAPSPVAAGVQPPKKQPKLDPNARVGDGQNAKSNRVQIDIDEYCPLASYSVHIGDDGTIFDASLTLSNAGNNNNKFYRIQLLRHPAGLEYKTWTRWGRVGEGGQNKILGDGSLSNAITNFQKKFKDKSGLKWEDRGDKPRGGKHYTYNEKSYDPDTEDEETEAQDAEAGATEVSRRAPAAQCTLDRPTQQLMQLIFNQNYFAATMSALNYDANKLPLGKLSKATILRGFDALKDLGALLNDPSMASSVYSTSVPDAMEQLSNQYYSLIPHAFGRNRPPVIRSNDLLKKEIELLESLGDMKDAAAIMKSNLQDDSGVHPLDRQYQGLGMDEMSFVDPRTQEFSELSSYLINTRGATHYMNFTVENIFRISRHGESERFDKSPFARVANRRLLWHGSRVTNFGGILGQGLRIAPPEAPVSGYMFGKGIYLADMSSKSANYCCSYDSGGTALLLLCEAELGNPMQELLQASYSAGEDAKAKGMWSTWGQGETGPRRWKDAGCVHPSLTGVMMPDVSVLPGDTGVRGASLLYNEYICYNVAQVRLRYLFRVRMH